MKASLAWLLALNAVALAFSQVHTLIDWHIGLYGPSSSFMSLDQAVLVASFGALLIGWAFSFGSAGRREKAGLVSLFIFAFGWSFLANGVVAFGACPPPCANAFPYQDMAHLGNIVFGGMAAYSTRRAVAETSGLIQWKGPAISLILLLFPFVVGSVVALFRMR